MLKMLKNCSTCKKEFPALSKKWIYCSKECRKKGNKINVNRYQREMRAVAKDMGNCTICFKPKEDPKDFFCVQCRKKKVLAKRRLL